jgi:subtilisin family serine protease
MKKHCELACAVLIILVIPSLLYVSGSRYEPTKSNTISEPALDFSALECEFGSSIPLVVSFGHVSESVIDTQLKSLGIRYCFGDMASSRVGQYYLLRGSSDAYQNMIRTMEITYIAPQASSKYTESPRDVSIPEINASLVWNTFDALNRSVTGKDILIADLDTGVDWTHPDLWFANGSSYNWVDFDSNSMPTNGTDYIDLDGSGTKSADEALYIIDLDRDGFYNVSTDWIWADNVTQDGIPNIGEPFFVANDTNHNGLLDPGESLVMLNEPKTKYIVEADGSATRNIRSWVRGTNLTISTHVDTEGHGTAVAGILLGGQIGYREYVGVAPDAELMMIRVLGGLNEWLTIDEGLAWAYNHGANVILVEVGSWTYQYLDGSSAEEALIDTIVSSGVPVIAPSGNLGGSNKHALANVVGGNAYQVDFHIPVVDPIIENAYITVLSVNSTDFSACNFSVIMNLAAWGGPTDYTFYLHPGIGYLNFQAEPVYQSGPRVLTVESFISVSSRSTKMLGIYISAPTYGIPDTSSSFAPPYHKINITAPQATTFHYYISDDQSSWSGGAVWMTDISNAYEITWPSTADSALSVASYRTRDLVSPETIGDIASFSSIGPRIDGQLKQGVAAPGGFDIISSYSDASPWTSWYNAYGVLPFDQRFGSYRLFSGTSASGPHAAGVAALMLQVNSTCGSIVAGVIMTTASQDSFTSTTPNPTWGHGKLNALAAVAAVTPVPDTVPPSIGAPGINPASPSSLDTVTVSVTVTDASGVDSVILQYYNGTAWNNITMSPAGSVFSGIIPAFPNGTVVTYRFYANDTLGNNITSSDYSYTVYDPPTTTTTTTTTTTITTGTSTTGASTTSTTTSTSTGSTSNTNPMNPDYLYLAIMLSAVLAVVILSCMVSRRRER